MDPLLLDIPVPITTPRLVLRPPRAGDGVIVNEAIIESFDQLSHWLPWADHKPTVQETEIMMRTMEARWILRQDLPLLIFDTKGLLLGSTGLHRINWSLPSFEIGYWVRSTHTGRGIITESTHALVRYAFEQLHAVRIVIKCDEENTASRRIAEKLNFHLEGICLQDQRNSASNTLRNTALYARYHCSDLPELSMSW
jgi:RimJ/RimL family protein N-acetyltransferase